MSQFNRPVTMPIILVCAVFAAAPAAARNYTVKNNCEEGPRCLRVYNDITRIELCLAPGQSYRLTGLQDDATYCAWCADSPPPDDCQQWPVRFD